MAILKTREQLRHTLESARGVRYEEGVISVLLPVPIVISLSSSIGTVGSAITISGSSFTGATAVTFGGVSASFSVVNDSTITAIVPAGTGTVGVQVTTPSGTSSPLSFTYSYDFSSSLPSIVTFSRASTATYFDAAGAMQLASINTPRFDHDPVTLDTFGLQIEGSATNLLLNSLLNGTNLSTQSVATAAQQYNLSFYGSGTITLSGTATGVLYGSSIANERVTMGFTPTAGTLTLTVSGAVKWAQLEPGPLFSSFIPTAGAAVTRSQDIVAFQGAALTMLQASAGSAVVNLRRAISYGAGGIIGPDNITGAWAFLDFSGNGHNTAAVAITNVAYILDAGLSLSANRPQRAGLTWSGANFSACLDGYTVVNAIAGQTPAASPNWYLLQSNGGNYLNGWVTGVTLYPTAISNNSLQQATSLPAPAGIGTAVPQGAAALGYNTNVININPAVSDIAPTNNATGYALADQIYYSGSPANPGVFSMTNGVLTIPYNNTVNMVLTQKQNSTAGTLPYLSGATGFYIEFDVAISDNNSQNWPAVWSLPWEHNLAQTDHYPPDPANYERWMELDVDEGGFSADTLTSVVDWQGTFDPGSGQVWRDYPTNTVPGNIITNYNAPGYLDRTQKHTFGASYSPNEGGTGVVRYYLDNRLIFKAVAPIIARQQHFYMIAEAESHGTHNYNMFLYRMRAYTP